MKYLTHANILKNEADKLLNKYNIEKILSSFGKFHFTGSYVYNLMTWRDIDIALSVNQPTPKLLFKIGTELAKIESLATMYYRNEFILKTQGNPKCIFWCCEFIYQNNTWKIDILVADSITVNKVITPGIELQRKLTDENRNKILSIKAELTKDPRYRQKFRSTDIYNSVIDHNISTIDEWKVWWEHKEQR